MTREERTAKLQRDRAAARDAGRRVGGAGPYGWRSVAGQLIPDPAEQGARWLILHLHGRGWPLQKIADQLDAFGIPSRRGGSWQKSAVLNVVRGAAAPVKDTG